jgi:hypothetical protein
MDYVEEAWASPIGVLRLLESGDGISAAKALIGLALNSSTLAPALEVSLAAAQVSDPLVRGNALLCFGHLARRFGHLPREPVYDLVAHGLVDANGHVRGQADAAADDLEQFLGWHIERP